MAIERKLDPTEALKESSQQLRGEIAAELVDGNDFFGKSSVNLLKHHGTYQQDDRDARKSRREAGLKGREYSFMVRTRIPGGKLTSDQLLAELDLCDELGDTTLRITSRQGLQLHGVLKGNLRKAIRRINEVQVTTLGACGDVERNVMCCPSPQATPLHRATQDLASRFADHMAPKTTAYHEIWLDDENGERQLAGGGRPQVDEPIYGATYLPRKFKTAIGHPHDNCIDIYTHDLGLLSVVRDESILGYNVLVGGGQGVTPSVKTTFPALAKRMTFVAPEEVIDVATAIIKVQRDYGDRTNRKRARLKYLIHDWGVEKFKSKVEEYYGKLLPDPEPEDVHGFNDHIGWEEQGDGKWYYGLNVENGRISDNDSMQMKAAFREICRSLQPGIRLTSHQSILFTDIAAHDRQKLEEILRSHGVTLSSDISNVRRWSMACVAWPTCGLSITESERALPGVIDGLEAELAKYGLSSEKLTVRMTGCPNGCVRPYNSDIGLVGKAKDKYSVFVGGRLIGDRLSFVFKDLVLGDDLVSSLTPLFAYFKQARESEESFGDFCYRKGSHDLLAWAEKFDAEA